MCANVCKCMLYCISMLPPMRIVALNSMQKTKYKSIS